MNYKIKLVFGGILLFLMLLIINLVFKLLPVATNKTLLILLFAMSCSSIITFFIGKKALEK